MGGKRLAHRRGGGRKVKNKHVVLKDCAILKLKLIHNVRFSQVNCLIFIYLIYLKCMHYTNI